MLKIRKMRSRYERRRIRKICYVLDIIIYYGGIRFINVVCKVVYMRKEQGLKLKKEVAELKKELDSYKALDSHYEEIEEDAKAIAKENEELKAQNKDLCVSLDIMNNRESELLDQIEKMKCCGNCKHWRHEGIQKYCVATKPDFLIKRRKDICDKWELAE